MAATGWNVYNKAKKYFENGTINLVSSVLRMYLFKSTSNASTFTLSTVASVTNGLGGGYPGSKLLGSLAVTQGASAKQYKFTAANPIFTAIGSNMTSIMYAVIAVSGGKCVCWSKLSTATFSVSQNNALKLSFNASGIFTTDSSTLKTYSTTFPNDENPLSEGGAWVNVGLDWAVIQTISGNAFDTQTGTNGTDDAYAHLTGFSDNHRISGIVYQGPSYSVPDAQEWEMHTRVTDSAHSVNLYEFTISNQVSADASCQLVKWTGAKGSYTVLSPTVVNTLTSLNDGDTMTQEISGSNIICSVNGTTLLTITDSSYATGQPGFGLYKGSASNNANWGFKSVTATEI